MTIISHHHKFIFLKARKVGGSSLLVALGKYCAPGDIVTAPGNLEGFPNFKRNSDDFETHMEPGMILEKISKDLWDQYFKFVIVRNPWEQVVSSYAWSIRNRKNSETDQVFPDFGDPFFKRRFMRKAVNSARNLPFYFDSQGQPVADHYIRFENLEADFQTVCRKLKLPVEKLPHLKNTVKDRRVPYWEFFDDETRAIVAEKNAKVIEYFGYKFGV